MNHEEHEGHEDKKKAGGKMWEGIFGGIAIVAALVIVLKPEEERWQKRCDRTLPTIDPDSVPPMPKCEPPLQSFTFDVGFRRGELIDGKLVVAGEPLGRYQQVIITAEIFEKINNGGIWI